jgi:dTDP-4-dehydrorhamnose reductase
VRTAAFFSPHDPYNFAAWVVRELSAGRPVRAAEDAVVSPTYVPDLVRAAFDLLIDGETGIRHLVNDGAVSWAEFAVRVAEVLDLDRRLIQPAPRTEMGWRAERPAYAALATERGQLMPTFERSLAEFAEHAARHLERPEHGEEEVPARGLRGDAGARVTAP